MHIHRNCLIQISMKFNIIIVMTLIFTYIKIWKWSLIWKLSVCSDKNFDRCFVSWSDQVCFRINVKTPQMISVRWVFIFSSRKGINFKKKTPLWMSSWVRRTINHMCHSIYSRRMKVLLKHWVFEWIVLSRINQLDLKHISEQIPALPPERKWRGTLTQN